MRFGELLKFSAGNLRRRKLRTVLTVLGVVIGTASIVVMMSLGVGLNESYMQQIENSSTLTLITVYPNGGGGGYYAGGGTYMAESSASDGSGESAEITEETVAQFSAINHVVCASQVYYFDFIATSGRYQSWISVNAMTLEMLHALDIPLIEGELPRAGDDFKIIAGKEVGRGQFYDPNGGGWGMGYEPPEVDMMNDSVFAVYDQDAYYEGLNPKKYILETCAVAGNPDSEDGMSWSQYDYDCYADFDAVEAFFTKIFKKAPWPNQRTDSKGKPIIPMTFDRAYVLVDSIDNVTEVQEELTAMGYRASSDLDYIKSMQETSQSIQYLLGGIGAVSLLVAAIGIANTMMMSIFERTKEIGIFKVLGCPLSNIRSMFLCEAGLIGLIGGVIGLGLSFGLSAVINAVTGGGEYGAGATSIIPVWLALTGIGVALVVALVAGISPAIRATKLSPLEAIRSL